MRLVFVLLIACMMSSAPVTAIAAAAPESFAPLVEKLTPAVVNISTKQKPKKVSKQQRSGEEEFAPFPEGHPFEQFNELFKEFKNPHQRDRDTQSLGSGFIIDKDGYVVTNHHVVEGADEITVTLQDDEEYKAELVGSDAKTDLALLKIKANKTLPYVEFGNSDDTKVGDWIVVVGNPFGLGGSVSAGIVSARSRDIHSGPFDDYIQTDAAINRGNSGGPMFNMDGKVIGISTAIYSPNGGGNVGIGFAIPSAMVQPVIKQLREKGKIERGWLGVKIQNVTKEVADSLGLEHEKGALVADVLKDSPAEGAKVKTGDIIISFDGKEISTMRKLPLIVAETTIGKHVPMEVIRNGKTISLDVKVGTQKDEPETASAKDKTPENSTATLGMVTQPLTDALRKQYNITDPRKGLLITNVEMDSPADERDIHEGDVILQVNQQEVTTPDAFASMVKNAQKQKRGSVLLLMLRNNETLFVGIPLE